MPASDMMLKLYYPGKNFLTVSVTGQHCDLMCKHCNARFLKHMTPAPAPENLYDIALKAEKDGSLGMLISGGSDRTGKVPIFDYLDVIEKIKRNTNLLLNLHTGMINEEDVMSLENLGIDVISFDVVGSETAVRNVYGLDLEPDYFDRILGAFEDAGLNVVPHVTVGLDSGEDSGEEIALDIIAGHPPKMVVVNSLIPSPGQVLEEHRLVPVLELAGQILPAETEIGIGCMRPRDIEFSIEKLEKCRISSIAMPPQNLQRQLDELGVEYTEKNGCCAFDPL